MPDADITQPSVPRLPSRADSRWEQVLLHIHEGDTIAIYNLPRAKASIPTAELRENDMIQVIAAANYHHWIAAKSGHRVGWLNTRLVQLTSFSMHDLDYFGEDDAQEITEKLIEKIQEPPALQRDVHLSSQEINRIINHLKGIARVLQGARDRSQK